MHTYVSPRSTTMDGPLSLPIVIPQQRPGSRERGFMAAYAPALESCGIDQRTFMQFIDDCNTGLQGNKVLTGVQVVSFGVGFTPELIVMGVATAVQAGAYVANKGQIRHKKNTVLDKYNDELFGPRGLYCMIIKYDPQPEDPSSSIAQAKPNNAIKMMSSFASSLGNNGKSGVQLRNHISGKVQGAGSLPMETAPLVYMDDRRQHREYLSDSPSSSSSSTDTQSSSKAKVKQAMDAFNDYLDRRARAQYAAENTGDPLNVPPSRPFSNRYLDPNHAATNGGLLGLLSGGALSADPERRKQQKVESINEEERRVLEEYHQRMDSIQNQNQSRREVERQLRRCEEDYAPRLAQFRERKRDLEVAGRERSIKTNILYLTIVNLPSNVELAAATDQLDHQLGDAPTTTTKV